jgi:hypothetical protein
VNPADRQRIEQLLDDPSFSCRAIARETGYSDWTIRKIARELDGDLRPMRQRRSRSDEVPPEVSSVTGWLVFGGFVAAIVLATWAGSRWAPPPDL